MDKCANENEKIELQMTFTRTEKRWSNPNQSTPVCWQKGSYPINFHSSLSPKSSGKQNYKLHAYMMNQIRIVVQHESVLPVIYR